MLLLQRDGIIGRIIHYGVKNFFKKGQKRWRNNSTIQQRNHVSLGDTQCRRTRGNTPTEEKQIGGTFQPYDQGAVSVWVIPRAEEHEETHQKRKQMGGTFQPYDQGAVSVWVTPSAEEHGETNPQRKQIGEYFNHMTKELCQSG